MSIGLECQWQDAFWLKLWWKNHYRPYIYDTFIWSQRRELLLRLKRFVTRKNRFACCSRNVVLKQYNENSSSLVRPRSLRYDIRTYHARRWRDWFTINSSTYLKIFCFYFVFAWFHSLFSWASTNEEAMTRKLERTKSCFNGFVFYVPSPLTNGFWWGTQLVLRLQLLISFLYGCQHCSTEFLNAKIDCAHAFRCCVCVATVVSRLAKRPITRTSR